MTIKNVGNLPVQNTINGVVPCEGPRALSYPIDFSIADTYDFDFSSMIQSGQITGIQCIFIDNSKGADNMRVLNISGTQQEIVVAANMQGYFPVLATPLAAFRVTSDDVAAPKAQVIFLNFYVPPNSWLSTP